MCVSEYQLAEHGEMTELRRSPIAFQQAGLLRKDDSDRQVVVGLAEVLTLPMEKRIPQNCG